MKAARLSYYYAASNGLLSCLPLQLTLRGKSTIQSYRTSVYYVDLTLRDGTNLQEAIQTAKEIDQQSNQAGFNQNALDQMARQGYGNAQFEAGLEEDVSIVDGLCEDNISTNSDQFIEDNKAVEIKELRQELIENSAVIN